MLSILFRLCDNRDIYIIIYEIRLNTLMDINFGIKTVRFQKKEKKQFEKKTVV